MYLWRRSVDETWWSKNGEKLNELAGDLLAIIEQSNRKRLHLEVASKSETELERVAAQFGRRVEKNFARLVKTLAPSQDQTAQNRRQNG